jgi:hypothetical protein
MSPVTAAKAGIFRATSILTGRNFSVGIAGSKIQAPTPPKRQSSQISHEVGSVLADGAVEPNAGVCFP